MNELLTRSDFISGNNHFTKPKTIVWDQVIKGYGGLKCVKSAYEKFEQIPQARGITKAVKRVWDFSKGTENDLTSTVKNLSAIWHNNFHEIVMYFEGGYGKLDETFNTNSVFLPSNQPNQPNKLKKPNMDAKSILETAQEVIDRFGSDKKSLNQLVSILQTLDPS